MDYGTLLMSDGSTGGYFANASQPFNFKAADSINADSVMVGIRVGWQPPAASSIAPGGKGSSGHNMSSKRTTINTSIESSGVKPSAKKVSASATGSKSVSDASDFTVGDYGVVWVEIKKNKGCPSVVFSADTINPGDTVDVTVRKENDDGTITDYPPGTTFNIGILSGGDYGSLLAGGELGSSFDNVDVPIQFIANENNAVDSVVVSIRATANLDVSGSVLQNAKALNKGIKKVSNVKKNGKKFLTDEGGVCSLFSNLYIQGVELIVVYPTDEMKDKKDITADPTMPDITAKAKLENFKGDSVHFQWNLRVQWEGDDGRQFDDPFKGNTAAKNSDVSSWNIKWDKIRGGDEITLDVTATAGGKVYDKTINHPFIITGLNPSIAQVKESLSLQEQVTVFLESVPKWKHFRKDHDFPVWGSLMDMV